MTISKKKRGGGGIKKRKERKKEKKKGWKNIQEKGQGMYDVSTGRSMKYVTTWDYTILKSKLDAT